MHFSGRMQDELIEQVATGKTGGGGSNPELCDPDGYYRFLLRRDALYDCDAGGRRLEKQERIEQLLRFLLKTTSASAADVDRIAFFVDPAAKLNAFATRAQDERGAARPLIVLYQRLIECVDDDSQLLLVLSHELGHLWDDETINTGVCLGKGLSGASCSQYMAQESRRIENEADLASLWYIRAEDSVAHPYSIFPFFQMVARVEPLDGDPYRSHDPPLERIEKLRKHLSNEEQRRPERLSRSVRDELLALLRTSPASCRETIYDR